MQNTCNICGANYVYRASRWRCPACGAYRPEEMSGEEDTLLYAAAQELRLSNFPVAEERYADIIEKFPKNHAAYWGRLLARHGIKYEEDLDGKRLPTCYATAIDSILSDRDYLLALEYADTETRAYYEGQAERIERIRVEWLTKAQREQPYDVFICYKESDLANGIERTEDSLKAQEIYLHLVQEGYRVFFSRESLRDKVGERYEPYIFSALSTARVMLVYGSSVEYITSTWLKNEWHRYCKRLAAGEKQDGSLLVAYEGFSPADLPGALAARQCLDAKRLTFLGDLDKAIARFFPERAKSADTAAEQPGEKAPPPPKASVIEDIIQRIRNRIPLPQWAKTATATSSQPTAPQGAVGTSRRAWLLFFLCLMFPTLGIHNFLQGRWVRGVLYILTVGFFWCGWVYDLITLFLKATDPNGREPTVHRKNPLWLALSFFLYCATALLTAIMILVNGDTIPTLWAFFVLFLPATLSLVYYHTPRGSRYALGLSFGVRRSWILPIWLIVYLAVIILLPLLY